VLRYVLHRAALGLVVLFGLAVATFLIIHLVPGDPVRQALGGRASPAQIEALRHQLGLDDPLPTQFWNYLSNSVTGQFGTSFLQSTSVGTLVGQRVTPSAVLIGYGLLVSLVVGVPLAILAALRPNGVVDHGVRLVATLSFGMPLFWLGLVLALVFGLELHVFPVSGYEGGVDGIARTLTLPALTLGLALTVIVVRVLRSSLLEVLRTDYIDAARARGLSERRIVAKHAMRNAIMPTITILAINVGFLIGGTVVLEQVFQIPGLGSLLLESVERRDYEVIQTLVLLAGAAVVLVNLAADILQAAIDPRVRLAGR
jgi:ABC-type dipeptide/oligopeptide/nickel transport system permease component